MVWSLKHISHMLETLVHLLFWKDHGTTGAWGVTQQVRLAKSMESAPAMDKPYDMSGELLGHLEHLSQRLGSCGFTVLSAEFPTSYIPWHNIVDARCLEIELTGSYKYMISAVANFRTGRMNFLDCRLSRMTLVRS